MIAAMSAAAVGSALTFMGGTAQAESTARAQGTAEAAPAARAQLRVNLWTTYSQGPSLTVNMDKCEAALSTACFGLKEGQVLGLLDPLALVDQVEEALGLPFDDSGPLPAPESASDPVVKAWNNSANELLLASWPPEAETNDHGELWGVATDTSPSGPAIDAYYAYDEYSGKDQAGASGTDEDTGQGYSYY